MLKFLPKIRLGTELYVFTAAGLGSRRQCLIKLTKVGKNFVKYRVFQKSWAHLKSPYLLNYEW